MPTVMRIGAYRLHFYSKEGSEPPHIHVARDDFEAKIWLRPVALVEENCQKLLEAYIQIHGH